MDFNSIIGHERTIKILQQSIKNKSISHSYLFTGDESVGKRMVATVFAKTLLCKQGDLVPCNECISCTKIDNGNHPDFFIIEPERNMIRRDEIEALIEETNTAPFESDRKIFLIDDSQMMNLQSQNAILKTLEEPPEYINIILISNNESMLLPTILSRVESIKFYPVSQEKIIDYLVNNYNKTQEESRFIANFTKGSVGQAINYSKDEDFFNLREETLNIVNSLIEGDMSKAFSSFDFFKDNEEDIDIILDIIIYWFRDLIIYKEIGENELIMNSDKNTYLEKQSYMHSSKINDIIEKVEETKQNIKRNINYQLAIEVMLLNIGGEVW